MRIGPTLLLLASAALALTAGAAFAAIDGNKLAEDYLAQGFTFVEVKIGPTQTKVEAIKNGRQVEVVYDNATGAIVKQEEEAADSDDANRTGSQVRTVNRDFEDGDDDDDHGPDHDDDARHADQNANDPGRSGLLVTGQEMRGYYTPKRGGGIQD